MNGPGKLSPAAAALSHKRVLFADPAHLKSGSGSEAVEPIAKSGGALVGGSRWER